ncbi:hypothetical protein ScPMuIL_017099 [Solemya velum]
MSAPTRRHIRWSKPRSLADSRRQLNREASRLEEDEPSSPIPYRLPRIHGNGSSHYHGGSETDDRESETSDKVWSRYGYEEPIRIPELGPQVKILSRPGGRTQAMFSSLAMSDNKLTDEPLSYRHVPWNNLSTDLDEVQTFRSMVSTRLRSREVSEFGEFGVAEPTPSLTSRCESPAKSVKSIHWMLGSNRQHSFDRKGRSHAQGPFSREFTRTCIAPSNWMKMKWGRSRTSVQ